MGALQVELDGVRQTLQVTADEVVVGGRRIARSDIAAVDVDQVEAARQDSRTFARGILRAGRKHPQVTGVLLELGSGERLMLRVVGKAPLEVRAELGNLLERSS